MSQSSKLLCKIFFTNRKTRKRDWITGKIEREHLASKENDYITVENKILLNDREKLIENIIPKVDVEKIVVFRPDKTLTFNKKSFLFSSLRTECKRMEYL